MNRISQTPLTTIPFLGKVTPTFQQSRVVFIALAIFALLAIVISQFRHRHRSLPLTQLPVPSTPSQQYHHHISNDLNSTRQPQASSKSLEPRQTQIASSSTDAGNKPHDTSLSEGNLTSSSTTLDPTIPEPIQARPSTPTSHAAAKIDQELIKRISAWIQAEKYSEIISLITQENLPKQREVFEPLFKSINEELSKFVPIIVHLRYEYISISFLQKIFSDPTENQRSIFDMHNIILDGNMTSTQKDVLSQLQGLSVTSLSAFIQALAVNHLDTLSILISSINDNYPSSQELISEMYERLPEVSKSEDHITNFRAYLKQMKTLVRQFGEIAEEASSLDISQLQQRLSEITQEHTPLS